MKRHLLNTITLVLIMCVLLPLTSMAQDKEFYLRPSYWKPYDQRGMNIFETSKAADTLAFEGLRIRFGAGFTQQFQSLKHKNTAVNNDLATITLPDGSKKVGNKLYPLQAGFNTAMANLFTDVQLSDGIRLNLTTYLSTRHHNEAWVKGGYIQFDKLPFNSPFFNKLMEVATIKIGHMEINYGDAHFRRSDGGHAIQNPFMENYIVDAFATEIGGEVYLQKNGLFGMLGVSNGMIKGHVDSAYKTVQDDNIKRNPSIYLKGGIDKSFTENLRVRVSGSFYHNSSQAGSGLTLYSGDRAGSNYWMVLDAENYLNRDNGKIEKNTYAAGSTSGRFNPGFSKEINAIMLNGFLKAGGLELFGTYEKAKGRSKTEVAKREMNQLAGDVIYRFGKNENLYVGGRYNTVKSEMMVAGNLNDVKINRTALAGGWFVTRNVLMKGEYVIQKYKDFPSSDIRNGGKFNGYVIEAVVGF